MTACVCDSVSFCGALVSFQIKSSPKKSPYPQPKVSFGELYELFPYPHVYTHVCATPKTRMWPSLYKAHKATKAHQSPQTRSITA